MKKDMRLIVRSFRCFVRVQSGYCAWIVLVIGMNLCAAWASAPAQFNYQGKLSDAAGNPITRAAQPMHINIYNTQTHGSSLFNETHMARVSNGVFSLPIGSINPGLEAVLQDNPDVWLEITVGSTVLSPRQKLVASPYALSVSHNSIGSDEIKDNSITQSDLSEQSVGADQIIDNTVTSADILNGTVVNDDISPAAGIALSKLAAEVLTAGGTRTQANLDTLTAGPASNADPLHTHIGLTPGDHAGTHMPGGGDSLDNVYLTTGTAQTILGVKTFNPSAGNVPFAVESSKNQVVLNLNADLLDGESASDFADSVHAHNAGDITSGVLDIAHGGTGIGSVLSGVLLGGDPVSSLSATAGRQFLRRNADNTGYEFAAIEALDLPNNSPWSEDPGPPAYITYDNSVGIGNSSPGYKLDVTGQINASDGLCLDGVCQSSWVWTNHPNGHYFASVPGVHMGIGGTPSAAYKLNVVGNMDVVGSVGSAGTSFIGDGSDLESLDADHITNGLLPVQYGGTGADSWGTHENELVIVNADATALTTTSDITISNSNVGIGTTNPQAKLEVQGTVSQEGYAYWAVGHGSVGIGTTNPQSRLEVQGSLRNTDDAYLAVSPGSHVGIGTTSPRSELDVSGDVFVDGAVTLKETVTPDTVPDYGRLYTKPDNQLYFVSGDGVDHQVAYTGRPRNYGEMHKIHNTEFIDIPEQYTWYTITNWTAGELNGFTQTGDYLEAAHDGVYQIIYTVDVDTIYGWPAYEDYEIGIFIDAALEPKTVARYYTNEGRAGSATEHATKTSLVRLSANQKVYLKMRCTSNGNGYPLSARYHMVSLTIIQIH